MKLFSTIILSAFLLFFLAVGVAADDSNASPVSDSIAADSISAGVDAFASAGVNNDAGFPGGLGDSTLRNKALANAVTKRLNATPELAKKLSDAAKGGAKDRKDLAQVAKDSKDLAQAAKKLVSARGELSQKRNAFVQAKQKLEKQKMEVKRLAVKKYEKMDDSEKKSFKQAVFSAVDGHFDRLIAALDKQIADGDANAAEVKAFIESKKSEFNTTANVTQKRAVVAQVNAKWLEYQKKAKNEVLSQKILNATARASLVIEKIRQASAALSAKGFNTTRLDAQIIVAQKAIESVKEPGISLKQARWRLARINRILAHLRVAVIQTINKQDVSVLAEETQPVFSESEGIAQSEESAPAQASAPTPNAEATAAPIIAGDAGVAATSAVDATATPSAQSSAQVDSQASAAPSLEASASATAVVIANAS